MQFFLNSVFFDSVFFSHSYLTVSFFSSDHLLSIFLLVCRVRIEDVARGIPYVQYRGPGGVRGGERGAEEKGGEGRERGPRVRRKEGYYRGGLRREDIHSGVYNDNVGGVGRQVTASHSYSR